MTRHTEQDGVAATQLAIATPAVLLLVMLGVQFALWSHASQLARAAADTATQAAATHQGTDQDGRTAALDLLTQAGNLTDIDVTVTRDTRIVIARVTGTTPQVVPGLRWSVDTRAAAPIEQFIPQDLR